MKATPTHDVRHIDYVYFWKRVPESQLMFMTDYRIITGTNSDHNGVVADFAIDIA